MSDPVPPGPALLLAPRLVDGFGFRMLDLEVEDGTIEDEIQAENSGQKAFVIRPADSIRRPILRYRLEAFDGPPPEWVWSPPETRYARPSPELASFVGRLVAECGDQQTALQLIVDHVGEVFWYGHGPGAVMDGREDVPLLTTPTRGHCLDMHGYAVAACRAAGIAAVYCAGFWFKQGWDRAPGMHCWFAARVAGDILHYDVSHQLKLPTRPVLPGLNPVPGVRVLGAVGKGLIFPMAGRPIVVDHFARLVWRTQDGLDHYPAHELHFTGASEAKTALNAVRETVLEPAC